MILAENCSEYQGHMTKATMPIFVESPENEFSLGPRANDLVAWNIVLTLGTSLSSLPV